MFSAKVHTPESSGQPLALETRFTAIQRTRRTVLLRVEDRKFLPRRGRRPFGGAAESSDHAFGHYTLSLRLAKIHSTQNRFTRAPVGPMNEN